ncbi:hypothetical protein BK760_22105 [Bacillus thuringiensis serovar tolworthi]|nr:hypothetical protein BK760_22105 [Bacillus thuringiensis serovar tolworthi]OUA13292.1 hypothetical protein BK777_32560 [Bacillus thuringiensis serovar aizawai]
MTKKKKAHKRTSKLNLNEEEIIITYYEDGYLLSSYMTIFDIDPSNSAVICTDAFYNKIKLQFSNIIGVK